ncbi:hypothetical protein BJF79_35255 [Actinomadura sp. CNU-125]|uniref:hypothetical protein n=1 Tax=Actinomadura sp. CNU-125 TaxID=1904961 RepID=UPI00095BD4ED|nr:hypothetical protein [Actinomadura sp. CNU-125]OLT33112.1 hypothetical protein BJF79_35255 [Actinomadura sp. CNU-125]
MIENAKDLVESWDSLRQGYYLGDADALVIDCVRRLERAAASGGDLDGRTFHTLGLVLLSSYALWHPESGVEERTVSALRAAVPEVGSVPCGHPGHPADEDDLDMALERFPDVLSAIAGLPGGDWGEPDDEAAAEAGWRCPRNIASFVAQATEGFDPAP